MHPEVLQLIAQKLTELVQRDLGYPVRFEWPENPERGHQMSMLVTIDRPLDRAQHRVLRDWCEKNLGAEWPGMTFWDHILED